MSSISQMPPVSRTGMAGWLSLTTLAILAIVGVSVFSVRQDIFAAAGNTHLHGPDLSLFGNLPVAIKIHILAAVGAVGLGAALMAIRKGKLFHRTAGWLWVGLVSLVAGSSLFITGLNHGQFSLLHLFTGWTLIGLPVAVVAAKRHSLVRHRRAMMGLFYGGFLINGFIAFIPGRTMWNLFFG